MPDDKETVIGAAMVAWGQIRKYTKTLVRDFRPQQVILFGSYARGCANEDSDVDLLVIMDHDKRRNVDQAIAIRLKTDAPFPMDMLVKRPAEVRARLAMNDTFLKDVLEDGRVLHG